MRIQIGLFCAAALIALSTLVGYVTEMSEPQIVAAAAQCCNFSSDCTGSLTCWDPQLGEKDCSPLKTGYCNQGMPPG